MSTEPLLEVRGLAGIYLRDTTFTLHAGEVLGIAGLPDSGRDELPRLLTDRSSMAYAGEVRVAAPTPEWIDVLGRGRTTPSPSSRPTAAARASSAR